MTCWQLKRTQVGQYQIAYVDEGTGLPVLFVHGFPLDHSMWQNQIRALADKCRVLAPDLPGFGASSPITAEVMRMEDFADTLAGFLDAVGVNEPIVYCGLSMGGYIAWQFWRRYPSRLRALILCDTRAGADPPEVADQRRVNANRVLNEGPDFFVDMMIPRLFAPAQVAQNSPLVQEMREVMRKTPRQSIAAALRGMAERPDARPWLGEIALPTLVLVGQEDALSTPAEMETIAAAIRGSQFTLIPGAGHLAPLENPQAVNAALGQFLETLAGAGC
ncbi:MAG: alpha/beta hydrolase [Thermoguttaceae bacterium]|nr:alpha/beta hydrolase [Thermoguttaceae bacterium]MDW8077982.1 alpha/beta fold hydrolase [Thermoguttaceae bacterium]